MGSGDGRAVGSGAPTEPACCSFPGRAQVLAQHCTPVTGRALGVWWGRGGEEEAGGHLAP